MRKSCQIKILNLKMWMVDGKLISQFLEGIQNNLDEVYN